MNICKICQLSSPSGCTKLSNENCLKDALKLIKASATNGNVIKALFPNGSQVKGANVYIMDDNKSNVFYDFEWWDRPYKDGDTE